jgi:hypothetical protein
MSGKGKMVRKLFPGGLVTAAAIVGSIALGACSSANPAADKAWGDANAACERLQQTDQRQQCFDAAMRKYQDAVAKANASTCPRASC